MEILSSMSAEAKWALINHIKKISLCDFKGEDVNALSTIILGIIERLTMLNSVPKDMSQTVISIFQTCFVEAFQHLFLTLNNQMRISGMHLSTEDICSITEQNYCAMKLAREWNGVLAKAMLSEKNGSELKKESGPKGGKGITCTGLRFQQPETGRPEWKVLCRKVIFWCNVCDYWNLTHFTKKKEGVSKHGKKLEEDQPGSDNAKPSASIVPVPKP
eukprot:9350979-Ditylum_brightwellii.AAC.1